MLQFVWLREHPILYFELHRLFLSHCEDDPSKRTRDGHGALGAHKKATNVRRALNSPRPLREVGGEGSRSHKQRFFFLLACFAHGKNEMQVGMLRSLKIMIPVELSHRIMRYRRKRAAACNRTGAGLEFCLSLCAHRPQ